MDNHVKDNRLFDTYQELVKSHIDLDRKAFISDKKANTIEDILGIIEGLANDETDNAPLNLYFISILAKLATRERYLPQYLEIDESSTPEKVEVSKEKETNLIKRFNYLSQQERLAFDDTMSLVSKEYVICKPRLMECLYKEG